jgi:hypothetical protein
MGCVEAVRPLLNADPRIERWEADVSGADKLLRVSGNDATREHVEATLAPAGYHVLDEVQPTRALPIVEPSALNASPEPKPSYYPLLLILGYLLAVCGLFEFATGTLAPERAMRHFMAGFFLVFSFFKLLNVQAFAASYAMYDLLAKRSRAYALVYPFLELGLGLAYVANVFPLWVNVATLVLMLFGTLGVVQSMRAKRQIRCACLGSVINLPVSFVTLTEDLLMAVMAALMLGQHYLG